MKEREYPFTAYVLTPSMSIKRIELVSEGWHLGLHETRERRSYLERELYDTRQAAVSAGRTKLNEQRSKLQKQQSNLEKRAANLEKSAAGL